MSSVNEVEIAGRIAALEAELAAARGELTDARAARLAALESEVATLRDDYDALHAEYTLINEELSLRNAELLQVRSEKETAEAAAAAAAAEVRGLKGELERLRGSQQAEVLSIAAEVAPVATGAVTAAATVPAAPVDAPRAQPAPAPAAISSVPAAVEEGADGWLGRSAAATEADVTFQPDHSLSAIPCASADDIIELRVAINAIRISTDRTGIPHKCSAYICGIRHEGGKRVYLALHEIDSDRTIIYLPSRQPVEQEDYERVVESAIVFAETTGFIINLVYLGGSAEDRAEAIRQIPVFGLK
ncbi:hypothetical protein [Geomonas sp.]|uniref:hypothetical protein n=1 Tax=Geomonas sp. TaxID=2651584 RepID=UPI002B47B8ED|nr:hypothetical protein [Geomonas sp.]HJV33462.1 hypothetical protein [Geomonas sp.]